MLHVLAVASEIHPLVKTGGLADVVSALPRALVAHDVHVTTLVPGYPAMLHVAGGAEVVARIEGVFGADAVLKRLTLHKLDVLVLDAPHLYDRPGDPYHAPDGREWPDNAIRFSALSWVAAELCRGLVPGFSPAILHAHDWQAGLAPAYLHYQDGKRPRTVMTVHNLAFQGQYPRTLLAELRLPPRAYALDGVEYYGAIGFLKSGVLMADAVTTVSPHYAAEIRSPEGGMGMDGLLASRLGSLSGIVNGIDDEEWNPATDLHLPVRYDRESLESRSENRADLERQFGLEADESPLFCVISRLTWQKGTDLLLEALPHLVASGARLAVLGSGDAEMRAACEHAAQVHRGRVGVWIGHDEALAHRLLGGADAILMPSRFEPCGLSQIYGLHYGCVPVVARVGGMADTIVDANDTGLTLEVATGVQFQPVNRWMLEDAITRAVTLYRDREAWTGMQRRGMGLDLSWRPRAGAYAELYRRLVEAEA